MELNRKKQNRCHRQASLFHRILIRIYKSRRVAVLFSHAFSLSSVRFRVEREMDFLSCVIGLCLTWILIKTFHIIPITKPNHRKLPPGPKPFPVIGNLLELGDKPHKSLSELAKAHGAIMSLKIGRVTTIVISSADMAKEVLQKHDQLLSNRTIPDALRACEHGVFNLAWIPVSSQWRNLRKICNGQLFSNTALDANKDIRRKKVQELLAETQQSSQTGEAVEIGRAAFKTALNLLSNTILSVDLADPNSDKARKFKEMVWNIMEEAGRPNVADYFPLLQKLDPQGIRRRITVNFGKMIDLFSCMINERLQLRKVFGFVTNGDMLDTLLNISEENSEKMNKTAMEHFFMVSIITLCSSVICFINY
jgi:hypothetical protein